MDAVRKFISENQHQFGYIMQEASRQWIKNNPVGALTVGDCNYVIEKYGQYHEILEKMQRYEKALKDTNEAKPIDDWHEEDGDCLWWNFPIEEPPYCGTPLDLDFPEYVTHFTKLISPIEPRK